MGSCVSRSLLCALQHDPQTRGVAHERQGFTNEQRTWAPARGAVPASITMVQALQQPELQVSQRITPLTPQKSKAKHVWHVLGQ
jgi:hypothetical protein